jgi:hypothetical protein
MPSNFEDLFVGSLASLLLVMGCILTIHIGFEEYYHILELKKHHEAKYPKITNKCNHPNCPSNK